MSGFITKAACRGHRPSQFASYDGYQRQELLTRLLKERSVARFVVAPDGYGKTCLAIDYAETVFSWVHTFFVNCKSPCFIRDLDDDPIASACMKADANVRLVVFDDVPPLGYERAWEFSKAIDELLAKGCEVLVTCTPSGDVYGQLQSDQIRLGAIDLLLSDEELESALLAKTHGRPSATQLAQASRVASLAWSAAPDAEATFIKKSLQEPMPSEIMLAMASMYVMQSGPLDLLGSLSLADLSSIGATMEAYPHLGYDAERGCFEAPGIPMEAVAQALRTHLEALVDRSSFDSQEELVFFWADSMLEFTDRAERACDVVRTLCPRPHRGSWVADHAFDLMGRGCFYSSLKLVHSLSTRPADSPTRVKAASSALESVCYLMLGDDKNAATCAKRFAFDADAGDREQACSLMVLERVGSGQHKRRADERLGVLAEHAAGRLSQGGVTLVDALAVAWKASCVSTGELCAAWHTLREAGLSDRALSVAASRLYSKIEEQAEAGEVVTLAGISPGVADVERYVRERMEALRTTQLDFFTASAGLSMERAHMKGMGYAAGALTTGTLLDLRRVEAALVSQRQRYAQDLNSESTAGKALLDAQKQALDKTSTRDFAVAPKRNVPTLGLRMFGRFELSIGGELVNTAPFRRSNVRSLLVLLAINQGKEVPRESLARSIWPNSPDDIARKNFYSTWSQLKRGLTLPDGTCPYILRHQHGCRLEARYVQSDAARLLQICRDLMFGRADAQEWSDIFAELDRDFSADLLPAETSNKLVLSAREDYRTRLVDALVAATQRIVEAGDPQLGVWFARMALDHDRVREDAYVALMRAQIANDQRTAAMRTFMTCKEVLAEELGVDPFPETMALYETLLD